MRPSFAVIFAAGLAAGLAGCSQPPRAPAPLAAVLPPPPTPVAPSQNAPLCVKPVEKAAFDVSALRNQLASETGLVYTLLAHAAGRLG